MDLTEQIVNALVSNWPLVVGLVIIGTWILKMFFPQVLERLRQRPALEQVQQPTQLVVQLDPEVSKAIHETATAIKNVSEIVERKDEAGTPLVYADRRQEHATIKIADMLKELADAQKRLADSMTRLDERFEEHDKRDSITSSRMADTMARIETIAQSNKENMIMIAKDHAQALKILDEIKRDQDDHDARMIKSIALQEEPKKTGRK